tara:strand:- start:10 stop:570 length:561 start_codon:yes stop_codon:yes gene_type:complete
MEYSALTLKQKNDYFDLVNSIHLKLKGKPKNDMKRNMKYTWKNDSNIMLIFMKLYESFDVYEKMGQGDNYNQNDYEIENTPNFLNKPITTRQHLLFIGSLQDEIEELEKKLSDVESGKGYITNENHNIAIQETKDYFRDENTSLKDSMIKYKNEVTFLRDKMECMERNNKVILQEKDKYIECLLKD